MTEKIKVCAYCRISTDKKEQQTSFKNQKTDFNDYFSNNSEYELVKIFADEGLSGTSLNKRKEFIEMLTDCGLDVVNVENTSKTKMKMTVIASDRTSKYKYIFVSNTSRFGRNIVQVTDIVRELKGKNVYVIFKDRNLSTENERDMNFLPHMFYFDELESSDKSHKVRSGYRKSANNSDKIHTNSRLYGYVFDKYTNDLVIRKDEAEIVRKIFEQYASGIGIRRILNFLSENGYKTRNGKDFSKSSISKIIENEKYAGLNVRLKYDTGEVLINKHYPKVKPKDEWIVHKSDKIEAIISEELFDKCQVIRDSKVSRINQKGIYRRMSQYSGMLKCSICGNSMTRNVDRGRVFYKCSLKRAKGTNACWNENISLKDLEAEIERYRINGFYEETKDATIKGFYKLENIQEYLINRIDKDTEKDIDEKQEEVRELHSALEKYARAYGLGKMSDELFDKLTDEANAQINKLDEQIKELSKGNDEINMDLEKVAVAMEHLSMMEDKSEYTKEEILKEIKWFYVYPKAMSTASGRINFITKSKDYIYTLVNKVQE